MVAFVLLPLFAASEQLAKDPIGGIFVWVDGMDWFRTWETNIFGIFTSMDNIPVDQVSDEVLAHYLPEFNITEEFRKYFHDLTKSKRIKKSRSLTEAQDNYDAFVNLFKIELDYQKHGITRETINKVIGTTFGFSFIIVPMFVFWCLLFAYTLVQCFGCFCCNCAEDHHKPRISNVIPFGIGTALLLAGAITFICCLYGVTGITMLIERIDDLLQSIGRDLEIDLTTFFEPDGYENSFSHAFKPTFDTALGAIKQINSSLFTFIKNVDDYSNQVQNSFIKAGGIIPTIETNLSEDAKLINEKLQSLGYSEKIDLNIDLSIVKNQLTNGISQIGSYTEQAKNYTKTIKTIRKNITEAQDILNSLLSKQFTINLLNFVKDMQKPIPEVTKIKQYVLNNVQTFYIVVSVIFVLLMLYIISNIIAYMTYCCCSRLIASLTGLFTFITSTAVLIIAAVFLVFGDILMSVGKELDQHLDHVGQQAIKTYVSDEKIVFPTLYLNKTYGDWLDHSFDLEVDVLTHNFQIFREISYRKGSGGLYDYIKETVNISKIAKDIKMEMDEVSSSFHYPQQFMDKMDSIIECLSNTTIIKEHLYDYNDYRGKSNQIKELIKNDTRTEAEEIRKLLGTVDTLLQQLETNYSTGKELLTPGASQTFEHLTETLREFIVFSLHTVGNAFLDSAYHVPYILSKIRTDYIEDTYPLLRNAVSYWIPYVGGIFSLSSYLLIFGFMFQMFSIWVRRSDMLSKEELEKRYPPLAFQSEISIHSYTISESLV